MPGWPQQETRKPARPEEKRNNVIEETKKQVSIDIQRTPDVSSFNTMRSGTMS